MLWVVTKVFLDRFEGVSETHKTINYLDQVISAGKGLLKVNIFAAEIWISVLIYGYIWSVGPIR